LMRPTAAGKKLILWREVLVLMEGSVSKSLCPGWERSATILVEALTRSLSIWFSFMSLGLVLSLSLSLSLSLFLSLLSSLSFLFFPHSFCFTHTHSLTLLRSHRSAPPLPSRSVHCYWLGGDEYTHIS